MCVCVQWAYIHSDSADLCSLKQAVVQLSFMTRISIYDYIRFLASDAACSYTHTHTHTYMCVCVCGRVV